MLCKMCECQEVTWIVLHKCLVVIGQFIGSDVTVYVVR